MKFIDNMTIAESIFLKPNLVKNQAPVHTLNYHERTEHVSARKPPPAISCFPYILVRLHRIFKILVPTPHNTPLIIGGRDKNFEDLMQSSQDIRKTRYGGSRFFLGTTLYIHIY